jgi:hypothetical protein
VRPERHECALDVADDLRAGARTQAELGRQHAIDVERNDGGVAEVDDAMLVLRERAAQVAHRGGLADTGLAGDDRRGEVPILRS